ncbi:MAG TPA: hypothetical protein VGL03_00375 [Thermoanaerobaculia bacterium]|jgi:hypothetical protein
MKNLPVACDLGPERLAARQEELLPALVADIRESRELENGIALRFDPVFGRAASLARVIDNERQCCRFLRFELTIEEDSGPIWLALTGPPGTRDFLRSVLGL